MNRSIKMTPPNLDAMASTAETTIETFMFGPSDWVPNHPTLPVLLYRNALPAEGEMAPKFKARFQQNGWQDIWQNGVFDYQHYHTGAHEVLGIAGGRGRLLIGGQNGAELGVIAGDCLILPAGTGHMRLDASRDFLVVGAYPPSQEADIVTDPANDEQLVRIASLALPATDPINGADGPLRRLWTVR